MIGNVVARRYASALFALGKEAGEAEMKRYGKSIFALGQAMTESKKLTNLFLNPVLSVEEKKNVALAIIKEAGGQNVERRFCELLADKGRLPLLPAIAQDYGTMLDQAMGLKRGVLTTAIKLDESDRADIKTRLEKQTGSKLELAFREDTSILGGLVLKVGDTVLDGSLRAQLDNLRESIKRGE